MKTTKKVATLAATLITFGSLAGEANGAVLITISESGNDVVATGSGTLNTTSLSPFSQNSSVMNIINSSNPTITIGDTAGFNTAASDDTFDISVSGSFGGSGFGIASSSTGDVIGVGAFGGRGFLYVPNGYVSGSNLSGSAIWSDEDFDSLTLTPGDYTWSWGSGANEDSLTVRISSVPEPSSITLLGLGALGFVSRRKRTA